MKYRIKGQGDTGGQSGAVVKAFHRWCRGWLHDRLPDRFGRLGNLTLAIVEFFGVVYSLFGVVRLLSLPADTLPYLIDVQMVFGAVFFCVAAALLGLNLLLQMFEDEPQ